MWSPYLHKNDNLYSILIKMYIISAFFVYNLKQSKTVFSRFQITFNKVEDCIDVSFRLPCHKFLTTKETSNAIFC